MAMDRDAALKAAHLASRGDNPQVTIQPISVPIVSGLFMQYYNINQHRPQ